MVTFNLLIILEIYSKGKFKESPIKKASRASLISVVIIASAIAAALATDFIVGDDEGWALNVDYQAWAKSKTFRVGDKLIFKYEEGSHNVHAVNGKQFQECEGSGTPVLATGNDTITLKTPGQKWYICGVARHCEDKKMHLTIDVLPSSTSPPPAPAAGSSSVVVSSNPFAWLIAAALSLFVTLGLAN